MILCCGESLIDMIPEQTSKGTSGFVPYPGGAIFNTAIGIGRLECPVGLMSGISTDIFGQQLMAELSASNVDTSNVILSDRPTTLAFVQLTDGQASYLFYDENSAGDSIHYSDFPNIPKIATTLCFGGISLCTEPAASAYEKLFIQEIKNKVLFLDPNIRSTFISDEISYRKRLNKMISSSDILKVSDEDLDWIVTSGSSINEKIEKLHNLGAKLIIVTKGAEGVAAYVKNKKVINLPAQKVNVIDTVGAGDTFNAGFLAKLSNLKLLSKSNVKKLSSKHISMALEYGIKAASITVSRKGANPPLLSEI